MLILAPVTIAARFSGARGRLRRYVRAAIKITATRYKPVANQRERFERAAFDFEVMLVANFKQALAQGLKCCVALFLKFVFIHRFLSRQHFAS